MQDKRSRLEPSAQPRVKLEDRYGKIGIPAVAAALDAGRQAAPPPKQMSGEIPEKFRYDPQS
jgi:hypothetical protein